MKLISQIIYVWKNKFAECGLKMADDFSWQKHCFKSISRTLGISCEPLFSHGRTSSQLQHHGRVRCTSYSYCWTICIICFFLQRTEVNSRNNYNLYILQIHRTLPSVTSSPTSPTETPRGFNRALHHSADCCRFYEN